MSKLESILMGIMFLGVMIGLGSSLKLKDLRNLTQKKTEILFALTLQYLLLPFIAFTLIKVFSLSNQIAIVLLFISCCPSGTTSNIFTYLSGGDLSLSVLLTSMTTLLAFFMTPLLWLFWSENFGAFIHVPFKNIVLTLSAVLLPLFLGIIIQLKSPYFSKRFELWCRRITFVSISFMLLLWWPKIISFYKTQELKVFISIGLLSFIGILSSLLLTSIFKFNSSISKAISFETGIQNAPLATVIISLSFSSDYQNLLWIPLLYGALSMGSAFFFFLIFKLTPRT